MSEERLNEIKDSVNFQRELLLAYNMNTLCVDEGQELIEEIDRLNNIINECMESVCCIEHNLEKYEEVGLDHFDYALEKTRELKEYLYEELKEENK